MAIFYEDDIEEIIEHAVNNDDLKSAIAKRKEIDISYITLCEEFQYRGLDITPLLYMANTELKDKEMDE